MNARRLIGWLLRLSAWSIVALPFVRWISWPNRVWIEGRAAQMAMVGERLGAAQAILDAWGLQRHYPSKNFMLQMPHRDYGFEYSFESIGWVWLSVENIDGDESAAAAGDIFLTPDGRPLFPPFWGCEIDGWRSNLHVLPEIVHVRDRAGHLRRLLIGVSDEYPDVDPRAHYLLWLHAGDRWMNVLHFECAGEPGRSWDAMPSPEEMRELQFQYHDDYGSHRAANFVWIRRDNTFVPELTHDPDIKILSPLPDITMEPKVVAAPRAEIPDAPDEFVP